MGAKGPPKLNNQQLVKTYKTLHKKATKSPKVRAGRNVALHGRHSDGKVKWNLVRNEYKRLWLEFHPRVKRALEYEERLNRVRELKPKWPENKRIVYVKWIMDGKSEANFNCLAGIVRYENPTWHVNRVYPSRTVTATQFRYNRTAGGIPQALPPQKMASAGSDWVTNPYTQFRWMEGYTYGRYGSPCQALSYRLSHNHY